MSNVTTSGSGGSFQLVPLGDLRECPLNPRRHWNPAFESAEIEQLAESIRAVGIIEPLVVRPQNGHFEIIAGSRRFRAAQRTELTDVPAMVRALSDEQALEILITENNQRADITPLEEADGYRRLLDMGYSLDRLAARIGRSKKYVWDRMKLLDLVPEAQELLDGQRITAGHAILLARLTPKQQKTIVDPDEGVLFEDEAVLRMPTDDSGYDDADPLVDRKAISVRELERHIAEHVRFDPQVAAVAAPLDFGPVAERVDQAAAQPGRGKKVVPITHDSFVHPDAKPEGGERTYCCSSWKRADGCDKDSPTCDRAVLGVVVVGPQYGQAFEVCIHKDCDVHWKKERQERERRQKALTGGNGQGVREDAEAVRRRAEEQQAKAERAREAWKAAQPAILNALTTKLKTAKAMSLADLVLAAVDERWNAQRPGAIKRLGIPKTPDAVLRVAAFIALAHELGQYGSADSFPVVAKKLGVDVAAILKAQAKPVPAAVSPKSGKLAVPPKNEARPLGAMKRARKVQTSAVKKAKGN